MGVITEPTKPVGVQLAMVHSLSAPPSTSCKLGVSRPNSVRAGVSGPSQSPCDRSPPHCSLALRQVYQGGEVTGGRRVYIGNINYETREDEIKAEFSEVQLPWPALACASVAISSRIPCTRSHCTHALTLMAHRLHLVPLCLCYRRPPSPRPAPRPRARNGWLFHMDLSCGRGSLA